METIVLLSCVKTQRTYRTAVRNLYYGAFFEKCLKYVEIIRPSRIFVLSSKYGLLKLDEEKEPYDIDLRKMKAVERRIWAENIMSKLRSECDVDNSSFILLAIDLYLEYLQFSLKYKEIPMQGLRRGEKLRWLNKHIK